MCHADTSVGPVPIASLIKARGHGGRPWGKGVGSGVRSLWMRHFDGGRPCISCWCLDVQLDKQRFKLTCQHWFPRHPSRNNETPSRLIEVRLRHLEPNLTPCRVVGSSCALLLTQATNTCMHLQAQTVQNVPNIHPIRTFKANHFALTLTLRLVTSLKVHPDQAGICLHTRLGWGWQILG